MAWTFSLIKSTRSPRRAVRSSSGGYLVFTGDNGGDFVNTGCTIAAYTLWDKASVATFLVPPLIYDWGCNAFRVVDPSHAPSGWDTARAPADS